MQGGESGTDRIQCADLYLWPSCTWKEKGTTFFRTFAKPVTIEDGVWIGGGAILLPGVTIGRNSVIGAGSVVTHSIPENCVAVGSPCRVIRRL